MKIYLFSMIFLAGCFFACGEQNSTSPRSNISKIQRNIPELAVQTQGTCAHRMCNDANISFNPNYYFEDFNPGGSCASGWQFSWNSGGGSITCGQSVDGVNALYFNGDWSRDYHLGWVQNKIPSTGNVGFEIRYRFRNVSGFGPNPIMVGTQSTYNGGRHTCCSPWSPNPNAAFIENVLAGGQSDSGWGVRFNNNNTTWTEYNKSAPQLGWFVVRWLYKADEQIMRMTVRTNNAVGTIEYDNYAIAQVGRPNIIVTGNPVRLDWYGQWPDYYIDYVKTYNFTVNYDTTAPTLTVGADLLLNATGPSGINYTITKPTATDNEDPNPVIIGKVNSQTGQDLTYPYLFPGGVTTIWWKATDISGNFTWKSQKVTVNLDSTPPTITNTVDINIDQQDATGANWNGPFPTITDDQDPNPVLSAHFNSQTAGVMTFPYHFLNGTSTIWWKGQDKNGNIAWKAQKITVIKDTQAPVITVGGNVKTEQQNISGTSLTLIAPSVTDKNTFTLESRLNSITGSIITFPYTFQLGITSVYWVATDKYGNVGSAIQLVEIVDTQKPNFTLPFDITEEANDPDGNIINIGTPSSISDLCDNSVTIINNALLQYRVGQTQVTWIGNDDAGNSLSKIQNIFITDTTPPFYTELDIVENMLPPKILSPSIEANCIEVNEIELFIPPLVEDLGSFPEEIAVSLISVDGNNIQPNTCLPWSVIPYYICWEAIDISFNIAQACQYVRVKEPSVVLDVSVNVDLVSNAYSNTDIVVDVTANGAGENPNFTISPTPDAETQNGKEIEIIYSQEQYYPKTRIIASNDTDWGYYTLSPYAIDKKEPEIVFNSVPIALDSLDPETYPRFYLGESIDIFDTIFKDKKGSVQSGIMEYSFSFELNNETQKVTEFYTELKPNQYQMLTGPLQVSDILCKQVSGYPNFCNENETGIDIEKVYDYTGNKTTSILLNLNTKDVAGNIVTQSYPLLIYTYYQALLYAISQIEEYQTTVLLTYEEQSQMEQALTHFNVAAEYEAIGYHEGSYLRAEKGVSFLRNINTQLPEDLGFQISRALFGDVKRQRNISKRNIEISPLGTIDSYFVDLADCRLSEAEYYLSVADFRLSIQQSRLAYNDLAMTDDIHVTQRYKKSEADKNIKSISKISDAIKHIDTLINALDKEINKVLGISATNARNELLDVLDSLQTVKTTCIGQLWQFQLGDNHFMECYILINEVARNIDIVADSLLGTHRWKTSISLALFTMLDTSLYLSPTSLSAIAKDLGYLDFSNQAFDPQLYHAIEAYQSAFQFVEVGDVDTALKMYVDGKCLMLELYNRYYSTRRVTPNKADPPDSPIVDSECSGMDYRLGLPVYIPKPIVEHNACGGCGVLAAAPGNNCGECGIYICSELKNSVLCNDLGLNDCGSCSVLTNVPGESCGSCGVYECNADGSDVNCAIDTSVSCNAPPSDYCIDSVTLRKYEAIGICNIQAQCDYRYTDMTCDECSNNKCIGLGSMIWEFNTNAQVLSPAIASDGTIYIASDKLYAIGIDGNMKWSFDSGSRIHSAPAVGSDGSIYVGSDNNTFYAINSDGSIKWTYNTGGTATFTSPAIGSDGTIYIGCTDKKIYALHTNGTLKWSYTTNGSIYLPPAIGENETIYVGSFDKKLYAFTPNGTLKWTYIAGAAFNKSAPVIDADGTIYIGSFDKKLHAINPDGTRKWNYMVNASITASVVIGIDGTIYLPAEKLYALNPDGSLKWNYNTNDYIYASPALGDNGTIYFSMKGSLFALNSDGNSQWNYSSGISIFSYSSPAISGDGAIYFGVGSKLYAIKGDTALAQSAWPKFQADNQNTGKSKWAAQCTDINICNNCTASDPCGDTGTLKWSYVSGGAIQSTPAIADDGTIYFGANDKKIYAVNADGTLKWTYTTGDWVQSSPSIASDGTIYIGSWDRKLYAINPNGTLKWTFLTGGKIYSTPAIANDGTIYTGSLDGKLYAINPNGSLKWSYITGFTYSSAAIDASGVVYIGGGFSLYAINSNGTLKWSYATGGQVNTPAIASDGTIYMGSNDFKVYAINPNGTLKWSYATGNFVGAPPVIGKDGTVYIGSYDKKFYALNPDGSVKWKYTTSFGYTASGAVGEDGTIYVGNYIYIYALNSDGSVRWTYDTGDAALTSITIANNRILYFGGFFSKKLFALYSDASLAQSSWPQFHSDIKNTGRVNNNVCSNINLCGGCGVMNAQPGDPCGECGIYQCKIDKTDVTCVENITITCDTPPSDYCVDNQTIRTYNFVGNCNAQQICDYPYSDNNCALGCQNDICLNVGDIKWSYTSGASIFHSPAIANDGTVYIGSSDKNLYAVNGDGSVKWSYADSKGISTPVTVGVDGTLYAGNYNFELLAFNDNGNVKWSYKAGSYIYSTPAIGSDGTIYFGCEDSKLYALNKDGSFKWSVSINGGAGYSSPAIASDGTIYIGSSDKKLYAMNPNGTLKWSYLTGADLIYSSPAIGSDGTIYVGSEDKNLYAINPDGTLKWSYTAGDYVRSSPVIGTDNTIYFGSSDYKLYALNGNGSLQWSYDTGNIISSAPVLGNDGTIYIAGSFHSKIFAFNKNGTLRWSTPLGHWTGNSSPAISADGTIYVGAYDGKLYAIATDTPLADSSWPKFHQNNKNTGFKEINCTNTANICNLPPSNTCADSVTLRSYDATGFCGDNGHCDYTYNDNSCQSGYQCAVGLCFNPLAGTLQWQYLAGGKIYSTPAIATDGTIYFGSSDYYFYALNADGTLKWKYLTGLWVESTPAIASDGTIYFGSDDKNLYAMNPNGTLKWKFTVTSQIYNSSPALAADGTVYFGCNDKYIYALNSNGTLKWKYLTGGGVWSSPAIGSDGTIYIGSQDQYLYAMKPDGTLKWKYLAGTYAYDTASIAADGTIYVGSQDKNLYALKPDGTLKWKYLTGSVISTPSSITSDGTVIVGSWDNYLYAVKSDGTLKWKYWVGNVVYGSPAIGSDGTVYIGSDNNNYLHAINGDFPLMNSSWPKFHQNNQNTGRK